MNPRTSARIVGVFYLTAMISSMLRYFLLDSILDAPRYLVNISENKNRVIIGTSSFFILAVSIIGIAVVIYPYVKKYNEALALGYVGARIIEGMLFIIANLAILTLFPLSQEFVLTGAPDDSHYQTLGHLLQEVRYYAYNVLWPITLSLSSLIFYYLLYRTNLIPRWISVWGFIAAPLFPVASLSLFGSKVSEFFVLPLVLNEWVLLVWLIKKGFNSTAIADQPAYIVQKEVNGNGR